MKVKVKIYGTLSQRFPGYQHSAGLEVELPDGAATVKNLLARLRILESQGLVVVMEDRLLKMDDEIQNGVLVNILQTVYGG
ncbi:MAG: hypothetical protein JW953_16475 [Anaerolineae bacterium]|nr:hypothetical protein [Anaerolineae bacterium]